MLGEKCMTNDPNTFYSIANRDNKLLTSHKDNPKWVDESDSEILYVDTKKDAEEIIKKHNLKDARIILCVSDGRGDVEHSLTVMFKFLLGIVVGLFLAENYNYTFTIYLAIWKIIGSLNSSKITL